MTNNEDAAPGRADRGRESIAIARESLQRARDHLDAAVRALPARDGDDAMAPPSLLALLLHAVAARGNLNRLESALAAETPGDILRLVGAPQPRDP